MSQVLTQLYADMRTLLSKGDDEFVQKGPSLLVAAYEKSDLLDGFIWRNPIGSYTRTKLMGNGRDALVFRLMEWPDGFQLPPHSHHGRPCIEIILKGELVFTNYFLEKDSGNPDEVILHEGEPFYAFPKSVGIIDPKVTEIHKVQVIHASASLNVYPLDARATTIFEHKADDRYQPKMVQFQSD